MSTLTDDVQRADPGARRLAVWIVALGAVIGVALLLLLDRFLPGILAWVGDDPASARPKVQLLLLVIGVMSVGPLFVMAVYLSRLGRHISSARRFPPPSMKVLHDTPVLVGAAADTRARIVKGLGILLAVLAIGLLIALWRVASLVE